MSRPSTILAAAAVWCLTLALVQFDSIGVYQLSQWGICAAAVFGAVKIKTSWQWPLWAVAVLFNPILPIHFTRDTWQILDGLAAAIFCITATRKHCGLGGEMNGQGG